METFETSSTTEKLDAALAKAQGKIQPALKDRQNPHFKSSYADLASVWSACREALSEAGVAVVQGLVHSEDNRLHVVTRLACSGEWIRVHFSVPVSQASAQAFGSAATYARRYALSAAVGVAPDDDDDGNAASGKGEHQQQPRRLEPPDNGKKLQAQIEELGRLLERVTTREELAMWADANAAQPEQVKAALRDAYQAKFQSLPPLGTKVNGKKQKPEQDREPGAEG